MLDLVIIDIIFIVWRENTEIWIERESGICDRGVRNHS